MNRYTTLPKKTKVALSFLALGILSYWTFIYSRPIYKGYQFEQAMHKEPLFQLIEKSHPKEYAQFIQQVKNTLKNNANADPILVTQYAATLVNTLFPQYVIKAPDEALYHYLKSTVELYRYCALENPLLIVKLENPAYPGVVDFKRLGEDKTFQQLFAKVLNAKQQIIVLAMNHPQAIKTINKTENEVWLKIVFEELEKKYSAEAVKKMFDPQQTVPPAQLAGFMIDFYTALINQGPEKSAIMMREMMAPNISS